MNRIDTDRQEIIAEACRRLKTLQLEDSQPDPDHPGQSNAGLRHNGIYSNYHPHLSSSDPNPNNPISAHPPILNQISTSNTITEPFSDTAPDASPASVTLSSAPNLYSISQLYNTGGGGSVTVSFENPQTLTTTSSPSDPAPVVIKHPSSLNRADLSEVEENEDLIEGYQIRLLGMVKKKIDLYPARYERDDYPETASCLILSGWPSAERLAYCGIPTLVNPSGRCRLHQFCPFCCWHVRNKAQINYVPNFEDGTWHFFTGSFVGDLEFTGADGYDWLVYWDAYKYAFSGLIDAGLIHGVHWCEELAVNSFLPVRVLPHVHAVIDAFELAEDTLELLKAKVIEYLTRNLGPDCLLPDIKTEGITDQKALFDRLGYMHKPLKLVRPYQRAWQCFGSERAGVWRLNSELTDLIMGNSQITRRRPKMKSKGTLDPRNRQYIGVPANDHANSKHVNLINRLKKQPAEYVEFVEEAGALSI